jgi:predicted nucleotidyltransferase
VSPEPTPETVLAEIAGHLLRLGKRFALVGGLAVSLRAEVRFTRDIDLAIAVNDDAELERLVYELGSEGFVAVALVEHAARGRLATVRLSSRSGIVVDLIAASCGIEGEVVDRATPVLIEGVGEIPVARSEELLAMKVLSMTERRLQDRMDAENLILFNERLDMHAVRHNLTRIMERGYDREQDLLAKLDALASGLRQD